MISVVRRTKVVIVNIRFSLRTLVATTTCAAIVLAGFVLLAPGVTVTVHDAGTSPLVDLQVHVTGKSYDLADIASGSMKKCRVNPTSESHVEISYRLPDGKTELHSVDCYFESGYRGTVDAEIRDGELIRSSQQIRPSFL